MAKMVAMIAEKLAQLADKRSRWVANGMTVFLFTNNHTPTAYDTLSDYSACAVDGIGGLAASWPYPPADQGDGNAQLRGVPLTYTPTGTGVVQDVYGWYAVDNSTGLLQFAQKRSAPLLNFGSTLEPLTVVPFYLDEDIP